MNGLYSLTAAISTGNLPAASSCFVSEGCMVTPDGTTVRGRDGIGSILGQMIASRTEIEVEQLVLRDADDVALGTGTLRMRVNGPEAARVSRLYEAIVALRWIDGGWKVAVLAPWVRAAEEPACTAFPGCRP